MKQEKKINDFVYKDENLERKGGRTEVEHTLPLCSIPCMIKTKRN